MGRHGIWLGPIVTLAAVVSYFLVFARWPALRDVPWLNLPLALLGVALSVAGLVAAWRRRGAVLRVAAGAGLVVSIALAGLFVSYVTVLSSLLPSPEVATLALAEAPDFELVDQSGDTMRLSSLRGGPVVLVFYRGFW